MAAAPAPQQAAAPAPGPKRKLRLLSGADKRAFVDPLSDNNPITRQVLGICSALAVTTQLKTALVMAIAVTVVTAGTNVAISVMRNAIPAKIRIIVQLSVAASLVIVADQVLKAFMFDVSKQLSVFVGLIITNCILMGRAEGYAMQNPPWKSFLDGLGNGLGYSAILVIIGTVREIFGSGTLLGFRVVPQAAYDHGYQNMGLMVLAPGAFLLLGLIVWAQRAWTGYVEES
jgi:Na+-transporting NADH:ubiquinone oxidoreductase subunit D